MSSVRPAEPPRALVTRPAGEAARTAAKLRRRGWEPVLCPLLRIERLPIAPALAGIEALLFTSAAGVDAFAAASDRRDLPVFTVGERTGQAARDAGFAQVTAGPGEAAGLSALLRGERRRLLYVRGRTVAHDLAHTLRAHGVTIDELIAYDAVPEAAWPAPAIAAIRARTVAAVLLYSARTADIFAERLAELSLLPFCRDMHALCLSQAVAARVRPLAFRTFDVPSSPTEDSLLDLLPPRQDAPTAR